VYQRGVVLLLLVLLRVLLLLLPLAWLLRMLSVNCVPSRSRRFLVEG